MIIRSGVETLHFSTGILRYFDNPYKLIVEVDPGIVDFYRSLVPKSVHLNRQMYPPHISVVRKEIPSNLEYWGKYEGQEISFSYSNMINTGGVYYWLDAYSPALMDIRTELGLSRATSLARPPGKRECFHITIGNTKQLAHQKRSENHGTPSDKTHSFEQRS